MWRNLKFRYIFQISPHLPCIEIWNFSTWQIFLHMSHMWTMWQIWGMGKTWPRLPLRFSLHLWRCNLRLRSSCCCWVKTWQADLPVEEVTRWKQGLQRQFPLAFFCCVENHSLDTLCAGQWLQRAGNNQTCLINALKSWPNFSRQVLGFLTDIFSFQSADFNSVSSFSESVMVLARSRLTVVRPRGRGWAALRAGSLDITTLVKQLAPAWRYTCMQPYPPMV